MTRCGTWEELEVDKELEKFIRSHLGKVFNAFATVLGLLLLPLSGCKSYFEYSQQYGHGKNKPYRILKAGSQNVWLRLLRRVSMKLFIKMVKKYHNMSEATKSRFKVTLSVDSTNLLKFAEKLGLVGIFWSGLLKRKAAGIELVVLYAVFGDGRFMLPLDIRIRRPDPKHVGRKCKKQPALVVEMIRNFKLKCLRAGVNPQGWFIAMDSWYASKTLRQEISALGFEPVIDGKKNYVFYKNSQRYIASELAQIIKWKKNTQTGIEYATVNVTSPTFGPVRLVFFKDRDGKIKYLLTNQTLISSIRIIVAYRLRWWIEEFFKILKSYLDIEKFQMVKEEEVYGHLCLRILCFIVLCYCAKRICRETIPNIVRTLSKYWFAWFPQLIDKYALSPPCFARGR